jgi:hypothetical protein
VVLSDLDEFLCLRAVEPDSTGEHAQTYSTLDAYIAARDRGCRARFLPRVRAIKQLARSGSGSRGKRFDSNQASGLSRSAGYALLVIVSLAVDGWICK